MRYHIKRIGGSVAQRDLWNLLLIRAAIDCATQPAQISADRREYYASLAEQLCHERCFATPSHCGTKGGCRGATEKREIEGGGSMLSNRLLAEACSARDTLAQ